MPLQVGSSKHKLESHVRCQGGGGGWRLSYNMVTVARLLERSETRLWSGQGSAGHWSQAAVAWQWWRTGRWPPLALATLARGTTALDTASNIYKLTIWVHVHSTFRQYNNVINNNVNRCYLFGDSLWCLSLVKLISTEVLWCSGYHICFTRRRSPVRSWAGSQSFAQLCNCPAPSPSRQIIKYTH